MDRRHYSPHDPYNSCNSNYGSYDSSHDHFNSSFYRSNDYPMQYGEAPPSLPRQQSHSMFAFPCSFCKSRMHMANDCYHLHGVVSPIHQQWSGHHQTGNPSYNTNLGWNGQQNFRKEEGYNYGVPNYLWEPSSQLEMPNLPTMTPPIQSSPPPRSDEMEVLLKNMADFQAQLEDIVQESKAWGQISYTPRRVVDATSPQPEKLEERHQHEFISQPTLSLYEQHDEVHNPFIEEGNEDEAAKGRMVLGQEEEELEEKEEECIDPSPEHDQSILEAPEVSKEIAVLGLKEVQEESPSPPLPQSLEQLEPKRETFLAPLIVDFVIPSHTFHVAHCIFDYISFCDVGVKGSRTKEQVDQREGNTVCSLQRRRLLPLWIFKENLKPD